MNSIRFYPAVLASIVFSLTVVSCGKKVEKIQPVTGPISESVYASGTVKSKNQYQVFPTVSGLIRQILVKEGDVVKKGDPLFVIQNETPRLNEENARLAAEFASSNVGGDRLLELKSAIETAQSRLLNDSLLLLRQRGLWAQQIGSKVELEQRELAFTTSRNNYQSAVLRYNDLQKQLRFAASQSRKQLDISRSIAQDYIVRSQTDGRVYSIARETGEIVNPQVPLAVIGSAGDFLIELQVDENDIARIQTGMRALLVLSSYQDSVFEATLSRIYPIMNERTRTFTVEAEFKGDKPLLYPNLTAEANIVIQSKDKALTIPRSFLQGDTMVTLENKEKRRVKTGLMDFRKVEILEGLSGSETIILPVK